MEIVGEARKAYTIELRKISVIPKMDRLLAAFGVLLRSHLHKRLPCTVTLLGKCACACACACGLDLGMKVKIFPIQCLVSV